MFLWNISELPDYMASHPMVTTVRTQNPAKICWFRVLMKMRFLIRIVQVMKSSVFWIIIHVGHWKSTDVSEEHVASIFSIEELPLLPASGWFLASLTLWPVRMQLKCPSKMLVVFQWSTWHYILEDRILHYDYCESLKSYLFEPYTLQTLQYVSKYWGWPMHIFRMLSNSKVLEKFLFCICWLIQWTGVRLSILSRLTLAPTQPPIQWAWCALSLEVEWQGCEADHSPPSSAKVKNGGAICLFTHTSSWHL
jgi:hypothetical protein